jgi:4-hydroxy-tetrahydrodipicolinate reductase
LEKILKLALIGSGKTGGEVVKLNPDVVVFNSQNPPTPEKLDGLDAVISFLPGDAFKEYIPMLIATEIPVVTGSTGFDWPDGIDEELKKKNLKWIYAHNFSLGINIVRKMIMVLSKGAELFEDFNFSIHEVHHTHKKDAPSGTAISFQKWLDKEATITSDRTGDVVGEHEMTFECSDEIIKLRHEAKDRSIFAKGALWAAKMVYEDKDLNPGLHEFNQVVMKHLEL